mmetsp:Transcript_1345/g.5365  ORF Transcript_1345/g.5365 Transcript_1345/m.5365 type:complete len:252 (+) Transcript_1345:239-994(+)
MRNTGPLKRTMALRPSSSFTRSPTRTISEISSAVSPPPPAPDEAAAAAAPEAAAAAPEPPAAAAAAAAAAASAASASLLASATAWILSCSSRQRDTHSASVRESLYFSKSVPRSRSSSPDTTFILRFRMISFFDTLAQMSWCLAMRSRLNLRSHTRQATRPSSSSPSSGTNAGISMLCTALVGMSSALGGPVAAPPDSIRFFTWRGTTDVSGAALPFPLAAARAISGLCRLQSSTWAEYSSFETGSPQMVQ